MNGWYGTLAIGCEVSKASMVVPEKRRKLGEDEVILISICFKKGGDMSLAPSHWKIPLLKKLIGA